MYVAFACVLSSLILLDSCPRLTIPQLASGAWLSSVFSERSLLCLSETIPPKTSSENDLSYLVLLEGTSPSPPPPPPLLASLGISCPGFVLFM